MDDRPLQPLDGQARSAGTESGWSPAAPLCGPAMLGNRTPYPGEQAGNAEVLVSIRPVDTLAVPEQLPVGSGCRGGLEEPEKPHQGNDDLTAIGKPNTEFVDGLGTKQWLWEARGDSGCGVSGTAGL